MTASPEASLTPTLTPTPVPFGHPDRPLTIGLVGYENPAEAETAINLLLDHFNASTGIAIAFLVLPDQQQLYKALEKGEIQAAWLQPLTYIRAHDQGLADVALLTNHFGTYFYGTQFLANVESGFTSYFDPAANQNTADLQTALSQLDGKRPCWVEPGSISGYILPFGLLEQAGISVQAGVTAQTYPAVVRSLYIKGVCDFGATFTIIGDPRTSSAVLDDLPDAVDRVIAIWQTEAVIPNLNFSFAPSVDEPLRRPILTALQDYVKTEDGKRVLTQTLEGYEVQDLKVVDDSIYDPIRAAVQYSSTDLSKWVGR
jgi:phosphonate transport system substrate-binding protein